MGIDDTIHRLFETQVRQRRSFTAALAAGKSLSYGELNDRANQLAYYLRAKGIKADVPVALCMERSLDFIISILAILKAGGAYLPLDPNQPPARILFCLHDSKAPILIIKDNLAKQLTSYQGELIVLGKEAQEISKQPTNNPPPLSNAKNLAYVIYTSGTTGIPKGVLIEHQSVINYCHWFAAYSGCQPQQRIDFSSNPIFDMAISISIVPLMLGLTLVIANDEIKKNIRPYLNYLATNKINITKMTPTYFKILLHEVKVKPIALPHLQCLILGGENLATLDCASWLSIYPTHLLFNEYGPTEATVAISQFQINTHNISNLNVHAPIGKPGPNVECYILAKNKTQVPDGIVGELYIGGLCLARGYLNQPKLTKQQFIKNPFSDNSDALLYKTGDLCQRLADGNIECIGRIDHQVKIRGFRIEPGEIEKCLAAHPALEEVAVLVQESPLSEKQLVFYYTVKDPNNTPSLSQMRSYLLLYLPEYMLPNAFVRIDALPLTDNGKLDRKNLPIPRFTRSQHYLAPRTALEKKLAQIWSEELGLSPIGIKDNFFELGGHSLLAARVISTINHRLRKEIRLQHFYQAPTISELATFLNKVKSVGKKRNKKELIPDAATLPLNEFQLMLWLSNTFEPKAKRLNVATRRRFQGVLDSRALNLAFNAVCKKHEPLCYHLLKYYPGQKIQKKLPFQLSEANLSHLNDDQLELILDNSLQELDEHYPWSKKAPLLIARLFQLPEEKSELQLCMSHLIADEVSSQILWEELSAHYLGKNELFKNKLEVDENYRTYLFKEQQDLQTYFARDQLFWKKYLSDAALFTFPAEQVVTDMNSEEGLYSTYFKIPEQTLTQLQQFCALNQVSINDGLCAALILGLVHCCKQTETLKEALYVNIVKSTRNNPSYDHTIGCFLRLEPVKINLRTKLSLSNLAQHVHQSAIETAAYQSFSSLLKLAFSSTFQRQKKGIRFHLLNMLADLYTKICPIPSSHRKIIKGTLPLSTFNQVNDFVINVNVHGNFLNPIKRKNQARLFSLKSQNIASSQRDLLSINNFFDVCFMRDEHSNTPYLVISANLKSSFRLGIAKEIIRTIDFETLIETKVNENPVS